VSTTKAVMRMIIREGFEKYASFTECAPSSAWRTTHH
jgi:hypothetical protein